MQPVERCVFSDKCFYNKTQHVNGSKTDEHKIKCDRWLYNTTVFNTTIGMEVSNRSYDLNYFVFLMSQKIKLKQNQLPKLTIPLALENVFGYAVRTRFPVLVESRV